MKGWISWFCPASWLQTEFSRTKLLVLVLVVAGGVVMVLEVVVGCWLLANILTVQKTPSACHPTSFSERRLTQQIGWHRVHLWSGYPGSVLGEVVGRIRDPNKEPELCNSEWLTFANGWGWGDWDSPGPSKWVGEVFYVFFWWGQFGS